MKIFNLLHKLLFFVTFVCVCPVFAYADVSCPAGYVAVNEDAVYVSTSGSCPAGHTQLGGEYGVDSIINCIDGLANKDAICTFFDTACQSGKYFDGTSFQTCLAGTYCDGTGTATPGTSGCSAPCPENSTSAPGASYCTCNTGYTINGVVGGAVTTTTTPCIPISCGAGNYLNGDTCEICPAGSYCANNIKTECDAGYTTDATGATSQNQCYTTCERECTPQSCPENATCAYGSETATGTQNWGGTCNATAPTCSVTITCNAGYWLNGDTCEICPAGSYCANNIKTECDAGYTTNATGASERTQCYTSCTVDCTQPATCPENATCEYGNETANGTQNWGGTCNATAPTCSVTITCNAGYWLNGNTCEICPAGSYCANNIKTECDAGYTTNATGASERTQCYTSCTVDCTQPATCPENATCAYGNETATGTQNWGGTCNAVAPTCSMTITCNDGYMLVNGECIEPEFTITTTEMAVGSTFSFNMSAKGTFWVDFDDGRGVQKINKTDTTYVRTYTSVAYTNAGTHTIKMYGDATGYNSNSAAISFRDNTKIKRVDGSLGAIFGGNTPNMFYYTFSGCTSLTSIPEKLFAGVSGSASEMFRSTFRDCKSLTSIPENLFAGVSGSAEDMFESTFRDCKSLTFIPENLFAGVSGSAEGMFHGTFDNCTSLTSVPENLFAGVSGSANYMFNSTFSGCKSLTSIPENLFAGVSGSAALMFHYTFSDCTSLTSIPENLFAGVSGSAKSMFESTFRDCKSLTSIPENLFAGVTGSADNMFYSTFYNCTSLAGLPDGLFKNIEGKPANSMFYRTFYNCSKLTGYIPANTFEKMDSTDFSSATMSGIFNKTALATTCPSGTIQYITGFESAWNGKVACTPCPESHPNSVAGSTSQNQCYTSCTAQCVQPTCPENATCEYGNETATGTQNWGGTCNAVAPTCSMTITCNAGYWLNGNTCEICPAGSYCANNIKTECDAGYTTDATGATDISQCYTTCERECTPQTCPENSTNCSNVVAKTTGIQYYGGTCNATDSVCELTFDCDTGYDKVDGELSLVEQTPLIPVDYHESGDGEGYISANGGSKYKETEYGLTENNTWASHFDYGTVYGRASCQPSMTSDNEGMKYITNNVYDVIGGDKDITEFETELTAIVGNVKAQYVMSLLAELQNGTKSEEDISPTLFVLLGSEQDANYSTTSTGQHCYCQMTGFAPTDGTKQSVAAAPWVFHNGIVSADDCAGNCVFYCANALRNVGVGNIGFRAAVFASLGVRETSGACQVVYIDIPAGQYLPAGTMTPIECPAGSYCAGQDDAIYDAINDQGITPCPDGTVSAPGATAQTQCVSSVKLHIGDDVVMNLVSARPTTSPVMVFQVGDTSYYAPMSATETPINSDTNVKYRVLYNETEYWVHDYTVQ